ncbi:uncharacterized protein EV422DRAFT_501789, partial [Fimicolochytrium jonesii]|uniref:uncharacterized protein n=1 Tax=Fimicolochytrium jonesii TaxID=1396493 RepID=UPI0022FF2D00
MGVSDATIKRRLRRLNLRRREYWRQISDEDLEPLIRDLKATFGVHDGGQLCGDLRMRGYRVTRRRIWDVLRLADPTGVDARTKKKIERVEYWVAHPKSLWHIDGWHKLINWRFVVHGGIDG